jgi:DNA-binding phage protein
MLSMTVSWDDTLRDEIQRSPEFRKALLKQILFLMGAGDVDTGKSLLRKYINATVGFIELGKALGRSSKTLMQMLGPRGNPNIKNFFEIVAYLQKREGSVFEEAA